VLPHRRRHDRPDSGTSDQRSSSHCV
jgi:hypothetical protein